MPHCRDLAEGLSEMTGTFMIAAHLLKDKCVIPYKYMVYSPKTEDDDCFEYIHNFSSLVNRALVLTPQQFSNYLGGLLKLSLCLCLVHRPIHWS